MKKYYEQTFNIEGYEQSFRFKKIQPTKLLSLVTVIGDRNDLESNETLFEFALENAEVLLGKTWEPVVSYLPTKEHIYWPANLEDDLAAINEIITTFIREVLNKVFTKSNESQE